MQTKNNVFNTIFTSTVKSEGSTLCPRLMVTVVHMLEWCLVCVRSAVYCFGTRKWWVLMDTRSEVLTERKNT